MIRHAIARHATIRHAIAMALVLVSVQTAEAEPPAPEADPAFTAWLTGVQAKITRSALKSHSFPRSARVRVAITVHRDGTISDAQMIEPSDPDPRFQALALHAVVAAGPFAPMPASYPPDHVRIIAPLHFDLLPAKKKPHKK